MATDSLLLQRQGACRDQKSCIAYLDQQYQLLQSLVDDIVKFVGDHCKALQAQEGTAPAALAEDSSSLQSLKSDLQVSLAPSCVLRGTVGC